MLTAETRDRLGRRIAALAKSRRVRIVSELVLAAVLVFFFVHLRSIWRNGGFSFDHVNWSLFVLAAAVTVVGSLAPAFVWLTILRRLEVPVDRTLLGVFFQAQVAKYIPGSIWQYAGRVTLARTRGLPVEPVSRSLVIELAASILAGGVIALLLLGWWGAAGVAVVLFVSVYISRLDRSGPNLSAKGRFRSVVAGTARAVPAYVVIWAVIGVGFWLLATAFVRADFADLPVYAGAFAAAWLVGLFAVYAPGGLGVREGLLVLLLHREIGAPEALVLAGVSRALLTTIDVVAAAAAVGFLRGDARRRAVGSTTGP
jgi:glycosyltransferase 2 family protein